MDNDTQVLEPAVIEPAVADPAVIEPAAAETIEPAAAETIEPVVAEPVDPITGTNSHPGSSSNTSNGNQVAVNSNFDYSTHHLNIYNYSYNSNTTTNQESLSTQMSQPSGSLEVADGFNCGVTTTRLARSYRFDSREYFRGSGRRSRVDRIVNFSGPEGDTLELSRRIFKGIGNLDFVAVGNAKASKRAARSDDDIIYEKSSGKLYFNHNGSDPDFGKQGGLFAIMETSPLISRNDFVII